MGRHASFKRCSPAGNSGDDWRGNGAFRAHVLDSSCGLPAATTEVLPFLLLFGATYFFAEFGPNTTTFVYPAEIFPVRVRKTSHGIAAAAGKVGAFVGTYALTSLLSTSGLPHVALLVAGVAALGALVTLLLLPEPRGRSLEELSEAPAFPSSAVALGVAESRGLRSPPA